MSADQRSTAEPSAAPKPESTPQSEPAPQPESTPKLPYIPIAGTWSRPRHDHAGAWYRRGSRIDKVLSRHGYRRVEQDGDPLRPDAGYWSGHVNGLLIQRMAWWRDRHPAWRTGGETLRGFLGARSEELVKTDGVMFIAHSHGGQVLAYALAEMRAIVCPVWVITVDMPVRRDMHGVYSRAGERCRHWLHLYSERGWKSRFRWLGNRFGPRMLHAAHVNREVTGGHSGILSHPDHIGQWDAILRDVAERRDDAEARGRPQHQPGMEAFLRDAAERDPPRPKAPMSPAERWKEPWPPTRSWPAGAADSDQ